MVYDVELVGPKYLGLVPFVSQGNGKESLERGMRAIVHLNDRKGIFGCEFDPLNESVVIL